MTVDRRAQVGAKLSCRQLHERTFAGAVWPDEPRDSRPQLERHLVESDHRSIPFGDVFKEEQRRASVEA